MKAAEEEAALAECVFHPEISKLARALKAVDAEGAGGAAWQRLYQRGQAAAKRQVGAVSQATAVREREPLREGRARAQAGEARSGWHHAPSVRPAGPAWLSEGGLPPAVLSENTRPGLKDSWCMGLPLKLPPCLA